MLLPSLEAEEFLAQRIFVFRLWFLDNLAGTSNNDDFVVGDFAAAA
jgi:hypothetical protein